jgi:hypothetical protein
MQIINRSGLVILFSFVVLLAGGASGVGKQVDTHLSHDAAQAVLPDEIRIQSAARIGARRLVVWGTTVDRSGSVGNALVMQMLVDTVPTGAQQIITPALGTPYSFVQVLALGGRFLVVWNDRRTNGGAFARVVDTNVQAGAEVQFSGRPISPVGVVPIRTLAGYLLVWNDTSAGSPIWAHDADAGGTLLGAERQLAQGRVQGLIYPTQFPDLTLIDRGPMLPLILDREGKERTLSQTAAKKFAVPYFLDYDASVASMDGNTVHVYRTLFDSVAERSVVVKLPEGSWNPAGGTSGAIAGSLIVQRNLQGRLQISYGTIAIVSESFSDAREAILNQSHIVELTPGSFGNPKALTGYGYFLAYAGHDCGFVNGNTSIQIIRGCNNNYRVRYYGQYLIGCQVPGFPYRQDTTKFDIVIGINREGVVNDKILPISCGLEPEVFVRRVASTTASEVDVAVGTQLVRLSAPMR